MLRKFGVPLAVPKGVSSDSVQKRVMPFSEAEFLAKILSPLSSDIKSVLAQTQKKYFFFLLYRHKGEMQEKR